MQFYNLTVQFICVILIHNERVWAEKTVISTKFLAFFVRTCDKSPKMWYNYGRKSKGVNNLFIESTVGTSDGAFYIYSENYLAAREVVIC